MSSTNAKNSTARSDGRNPRADEPNGPAPELQGQFAALLPTMCNTVLAAYRYGVDAVHHDLAAVLTARREVEIVLLALTCLMHHEQPDDPRFDSFFDLAQDSYDDLIEMGIETRDALRDRGLAVDTSPADVTLVQPSARRRRGCGVSR